MKTLHTNFPLNILRNTGTILILFSLTLSVFACTPAPITSQNANVISLKGNFSAIEEAALDWDENAYLRKVIIPLYGSTAENQNGVISAYFQSRSQVSESLQVNLHADGSTTSIISDYEEAVTQAAPIVIDDHMIDSANILSYFESEKLVRERQPDVRATLYLEEITNEASTYIVWRLAIDTPNSDHEYVDAYSGEKLGRYHEEQIDVKR